MKEIIVLEKELKEKIYDWCSSQPLEHITHSSYVKSRLEKWYRHGSNLRSIKSGQAVIFSCDDLPLFLQEIGDRYLPKWYSALVCGGPTSIGWHRDHGHFDDKAVMINLGEAIYEELPRFSDMKSFDGLVKTNLTDGMVVELDIKCPHKATQTSKIRFNITYRTFKEKFKQNKDTKDELQRFATRRQDKNF